MVGAAGQCTNLGIAQNVERLYGKVHEFETTSDKPMKTRSASISVLEYWGNDRDRRRNRAGSASSRKFAVTSAVRKAESTVHCSHTV